MKVTATLGHWVLTFDKPVAPIAAAVMVNGHYQDGTVVIHSQETDLRRAVKLARLRTPFNKFCAVVIESFWPTAWTNMVLGDDLQGMRITLRGLVQLVSIGGAAWLLTRWTA